MTVALPHEAAPPVTSRPPPPVPERAAAGQNSSSPSRHGFKSMRPVPTPRWIWTGMEPPQPCHAWTRPCRPPLPSHTGSQPRRRSCIMRLQPPQQSCSVSFFSFVRFAPWYGSCSASPLFHHSGFVAQLVVALVCNQGIRGSSPHGWHIFHAFCLHSTSALAYVHIGFNVNVFHKPCPAKLANAGTLHPWGLVFKSQGALKPFFCSFFYHGYCIYILKTLSTFKWFSQ